MSDNFYRAFEDRHRGSRELIKRRLAAYLPFIEPLLSNHPGATAVDLGCGRGEWIELLSGLGFKPVGVDLDAGMLEACRDLGLEVELGDAIAYLSTMPDESQVVISAFHVVEHITFEQLRTLIAQALRVLKSGGLLIMETPNPENIVVATHNFYVDPSHQRPVPSQLLSFVAQYTGFERVKTLRLHESKELAGKENVGLQEVFAGASPDYAIIAQKRGTPEVLALLDSAFGREYGLSLDDLLCRWDSRFNRLEAKAQQAEAKAQQAEAKAQQAEAASNERFAQLQAVYASTSWKVTKPLRSIKRLLSGDFSALWRSTAAVKLNAKQTFRPLVASGIAYVNKNPAFRNRLKRAVAKFPALHQRLLRVAVNTDALKSSHPPGSFRQPEQSALPPELQAMTPRARQIYQDLKAAIESKNKEVA